MLTNAILRHGIRNPDRPALVDTTRTVTYGELRRRVLALTVALRRLNLMPGDRVGLRIGNRAENIEAILAVAHSGLVAFPMDPAWSPAEADENVLRFRLQALIAEKAAFVTCLADAARSQVDGRVICLEPLSGALPYHEVAEADIGPEGAAHNSPETIFTVSLTSGTTGKAKAISLTHNNMLHRFFAQVLEFGFNPSDRLLVTTPLYYGAARSYTLNHLLVGASVYLSGTFEPVETLSMIEAHGITTSFLVPTQLRRILQSPALNACNTTSLRVLISSGANLDPATRQNVIGHLTSNLYEVYATTEAGALSVLRPDEQLTRPTSTGQVLWNTEIRVVADDLKDAAAMEPGELLCRGPAVFPGYFDDAAATAEAFAGDWFRTGDVGYVDEEGYLHLTGRKKEMIVSGGRNIYPAEVETVLQQHPSVGDAAVIGIHDHDWGEAVWACIVTRPGEKITAPDLAAYCRQHLASYKIPKVFRFMSQIPKAPSGKVDRRALMAACQTPDDK